MVTYVLSDAHVDGLRDPVQTSLVGWLRGLPAGHVVILGDLFHRWWDWGDAVFTAYVPLVAALSGFVERGGAVTFVKGNHDFSVDTLRRFGLDVCDSLVLESGGQRYHLAHGDQVDMTPGYRLTRRVLRGPLFAAALRALGPRRAWSFLGRLAGPAHADRQPSSRLRAAQRRYARRVLASGCQVVVLGHSHVVEEQRWPEGRYINLGAFDQTGRLLVIQGDGARYQGLGQVGSEQGPLHHVGVLQRQAGAQRGAAQGAGGQDDRQPGDIPDHLGQAGEQGAAP